MPPLLTSCCVLSCSFGEAPSLFDALPLPGKPTVEEAFVAATIEEIVPELNVPSFAMCSSPENPEVIAATAAAEGVLTPMPCVPVILDPWEPPSPTDSFEGVPLATVDSRCLCAWGGEISVDSPAQVVVADEA